MEYSPIKMNQLLEQNNFHLKKKYGQNFIIDENIIDNIIKKADINENTLVIEIGPGAGSLTQKLCQYAKQVICYEIDESLKPILSTSLTSDNVEVIYEDFLKADVKADLKKYSYDKLYVVANLPYYITTPILIKIMEEDMNIDKLVVMVQKEVGDRFKAKPGSKEYNSLSIYIHYHYTVKKIMDVNRQVFMPKPNVDSIVLEFNKKEPIPLKDKEFFFKLVRDSFTQKRKTIKNNLKNYDLNKIEEVLKKYGYDLSVRAEQLDLSVFVDIANSY